MELRNSRMGLCARAEAWAAAKRLLETAAVEFYRGTNEVMTGLWADELGNVLQLRRFEKH